MLRAFGNGLVASALAFVVIVLFAAIRAPEGGEAGSMIAGGVFFVVMFVIYALIFAAPFVLLVIAIAAIWPDWTARNPWWVAAIMIALVVVIFGPQDNLLRYSGIGMGSLVSGLFARRWSRRHVTP